MKRPSRLAAGTAALVTALLTATACSQDTSQNGADPAPSRVSESASAMPSTGSPTSSEATDSAQPDDGTQRPCPKASTLSKGRTSGEGTTASLPGIPELRDVRISSHDTCDLVTFTFSGPAPSYYFAGYEDPLSTPGRGDVVTMPGEVHLKLVLSGVPRATSLEGHEDVRTTETVRGLKDLGVFEGELTVGVGLDTADGEPTGYAVTVEGSEVVLALAHS